MKELIAAMKEQMDIVKDNIDLKPKVAEAKVRKATLALEKLGKKYRKDSIDQYK